VPLPDRDKRVLPPSPAAGQRPPSSPRRFDQPDPGEPGLGVAAGISAAQLRRLRSGRIRPDRVVDLHEHRADRCLLVIHGKGLRSSGKAVLRSALPEWLASPDLEGCVLAFAPAQPEDGGSGATYVLLRRTRV
jgi:DNA-nicking Smr family endonuclease